MLRQDADVKTLPMRVKNKRGEKLVGCTGDEAEEVVLVTRPARERSSCPAVAG
jgi:hypothetical protein